MTNYLHDYANQAIAFCNPLASLAQTAAEKQLRKETAKKERLIASIQAQANVLVTSQPEKAQQLYIYVESLTKRCLHLKEQCRLEKVDGICTRLGKLCILSNLAMPGTGDILIALSIAGKSANVFYHAINPAVNGESLYAKAKSLGWDYAFNGTWTAASYLLKK